MFVVYKTLFLLFLSRQTTNIGKKCPNKFVENYAKLSEYRLLHVSEHLKCHAAFFSFPGILEILLVPLMENGENFHIQFTRTNCYGAGILAGIFVSVHDFYHTNEETVMYLYKVKCWYLKRA